MVEQSLTKLGGKAHCSFGGKKLCRDGGHQPHHCQRQQAQPHPDDMPPIHVNQIPDALINNAGHHQRHQKLEKGLQKLKKRRQNRFLFIIPQIFQQSFHPSILLPNIISIPAGRDAVPLHSRNLLPDKAPSLRQLFLSRQ